MQNDTTFYMLTAVSGMDNLAPIPQQTSTFTGNVRGYYFIAPVDFTLTGLWVPTDASSGEQNIEVLRFNNQTLPPVYPITTNNFESLGYWSNYNANDTIDLCASIHAGDVIGIYGNRLDINSYTQGANQTNINGFPISLYRSGMQNTLSTNQMIDVWTEAGTNISRIEFFYDVTIDSVIEAVNVIVPNSITISLNASICSGDSLFIQGDYQTVSGFYIDTLQTIYGCDSIVSTTLTINELSNIVSNVSICSGDSLFVQGDYQTVSGIYVDTLQTIYGCDSIVSTTLTINELSNIVSNVSICSGDSLFVQGDYQTVSGIYFDTLQSIYGCDSIVSTTLTFFDTPTLNFMGDTLCAQDGSIQLNAMPTGGIYAGPGISGSQLNAALAGSGNHLITYSYSDSLGCSNNITAIFVIQDCASINENNIGEVLVYPNPTASNITILFNDDFKNGYINLFDLSGKIVGSWSLNSTITCVDIEHLSAGRYILEINTTAGVLGHYRIIKK